MDDDIKLLPLLQALEIHESRQLKDRMIIMTNRIKQLEERMAKTLDLFHKRLLALEGKIEQILPEVN